MKLFFKVMALLAMIALLGACNLEIGTDDDTDDGDTSGIDYTSYNANAAIYVDNNTSQDLVAFMGSLSEDNILGGIPARAQYHAIKKDPALFDRTKDFPMILLTEEQYTANKGNLKTLESTPFTRVYVFYNANGDNLGRHQISERVGGNFKLRIENRSSMNVELRLGGIGGETIGYAAKDMVSTTLYVGEGDYDIFPIFKAYNPVRDIMETFIPRAVDGYAWFLSFGFEGSSGERIFNVEDALNTLNTTRTTGAAWLVINNQTSNNTDIRLVKGGTPVRSPTGVSYFSGTKEFQIDMPSSTIGNETTFQSKMTIGNYEVGVSGKTVNIKTTTGSTTFEVESDKMYTVNVTGDTNGTLEAVIDLEGATDIDYDYL